MKKISFLLLLLNCFSVLLCMSTKLEVVRYKHPQLSKGLSSSRLNQLLQNEEKRELLTARLNEFWFQLNQDLQEKILDSLSFENGNYWPLNRIVGCSYEFLKARIIASHSDYIQVLAVGEKYFASVDLGNNIKIFNFEGVKNSEIRLAGANSQMLCLVLSKQDRMLFCGCRNGLHIFNRETSESEWVEHQFLEDNWVNCISVRLDGKQFVYGNNDGEIYLGDPDGNPKITKRYARPVCAIAFSSNGEFIFSSAANGEIKRMDRGVIWRGSKKYKKVDKSIWGTSLSISKDDSKLVVGYKNGKISIFDLENDAAESTDLKVHSDSVRSVIFSRDGKRIISGSDDGTIIIWDECEKDRWIPMILNEHFNVTGLAYLNNDQIASGSSSQDVKIWSPKRSSEIRSELGLTYPILYTLLYAIPESAKRRMSGKILKSVENNLKNINPEIRQELESKVGSLSE